MPIMEPSTSRGRPNTRHRGIGSARGVHPAEDGRNEGTAEGGPLLV